MMGCIFFLIMLLLNYQFLNFKYFLSNLIMMLNLLMLLKFDFFIDWLLIGYNFGLNFYSFSLIILCFWIMGLVIKILNNFNKIMCINIILILLIVLVMIFSSLNLLLFYFFFEVSLILTFLLIIYWGLGEMRLLSGFYFMFYTLFFSMPLLIFVYLYMYKLSLNLFNLMEFIEFKMNYFLFFFMIMSFFVKIPAYMVHGWLLKAHVEAPVFGSMILASILLKLGTYGLLRFMLMFSSNFLNMSIYFLMLNLLGSILLSIICIRQIDMKILVAYSSIVHMGLLLSGMFTLLKLSLIGSYLMMVSHGLCSSGMFYLVNVCYCETNSRLMIINKGMLNFMPSMSMMWFMLCSSNMSAPVSLNLVSEIMLLLSLILWYKIIFLYLMLFCFFSFLYSLYLFSYIQHGVMNFFLKIKSGKFLDYFILLMHWIPLNFMFLNMNLFM